MVEKFELPNHEIKFKQANLINMSLTQEAIISAIEAEKQGGIFPLSFEDIWETFGYTSISQEAARRNTRRFILHRSGLEKYTYPNGYGQESRETSLSRSYLVDESDKIHFSLKSYEFALAKANTDKGNDFLEFLIDTKDAYIKTLQNQFNAPSAEKEIPTCQIPGFPRSAEDVKADSGLSSVAYVKSCIKRDFIEGEDYQIDGKKFMVTEWCYRVSVGNSRSKKGRQVSASAIRLIGKADWDRLDEYQTRKETLMNARQPQNGNVANGQLELNLHI